MNVNWCTSCKCVLANEEVVNGVCERCGSEVVHILNELRHSRKTGLAEVRAQRLISRQPQATRLQFTPQEQILFTVQHIW